MASPDRIAKAMKLFADALKQHDQANPSHTAWGIGVAYFDLERLGFEEGEEILPGIVIQVDGGTAGNFRILCDGQHGIGETEEVEEIVEAVSTHEVYAPAGPPRVTPPV